MKLTLTKDQAYTILTALECAKYDEDDDLGYGFEKQFNKKLNRLAGKIQKELGE